MIQACTDTLLAGALEDERAACREAGMDGFVPKPIKMPELLAALDAHLGDRAAATATII